MADYLYEIKGWEELNTIELYQLLALRSEVFVVEQACAYQDVDGQDPAATHLLVRDDSENLVAYARMYDTRLAGKDYCAIGRVCTAQPHRREGISRILMERAIEHIDHKFKRPITVSAQAYLETFYQSLGFDTVSEPYLEDGIPHIRMVREK
ncbi:GNAT family N-acetyltransferase [Kangiella marina]|uniref:GNAT family N-acetyltransferase n=1 Tax=Kangiella marina TaxID=1079178 RepID=A0ABP8IJ84_9GAMM